MIYIKNTHTGTIALLLLMSLLFAASSGSIAYAEIEETADTQFSADNIVTGKMNNHSKRSIIVNNSRYRYCKDVIAFSPVNTRIPIHDIDTAETVKLFIKNNSCVRKIKVLRFGE